MASPELQGVSGIVEEVEDGRKSKNMEEIERSGSVKVKKKKKKSKVASFYTPKFGCFSIESEEDGRGNFDMEVDEKLRRRNPTHLIVMVNGLIGSAQNWKFAAKQFLRKFPEDVIVHCSESNSSMMTFDGVDVMGERLTEEVISVIKRHPDVQKISFISHSLGGLISRYAIARLYERDIKREKPQENGDSKSDGSENPCLEEKFKGKIAGLEPVNFITSATPHLGSRGHRQVPVFCGVYRLEKAASHISWFLGKSGKHLFLTDGKNGKQPLLLQMASDHEDLKFMSALQSFRRRVAYANVHFDHIVGWGTSSLRRRTELLQLKKKLSRDDKYPHIVNVEAAKTASPEEVPMEAKVNGYKNTDMEEEMLKSLTKMSWERVDVSFRGSRQKYLAHNTIQVKTYCINSDGADVIQHMIDNFLL
ncbi:hypothetical protein UlMin_034823 [Ulmus minor]